MFCVGEVSWGHSYGLYFGAISTDFRRKKLAMILKSNVIIHFKRKLALSWEKNVHIFVEKNVLRKEAT
jgi:hypothetical protein